MNESTKEKYKEYLNTREGVESYNRFKEIMYDNPDSLMMRLFEHVAPKIKAKNINILDVGGGDGKRLKLFMKLLEVQGFVPKATIVEQSKVFIDDLEMSLIDHKLKYDIKLVHSTFENYQPKEKFDLVLFVHSIYSFQDRFYIEKIRRSLKSGGVVIFIVNEEKSFLAGLKDILDDSFSVKRKNVITLQQDLLEENFVIDVKTSDTRFNNCLKNNTFTDESKLIVSWIAMQDWDKIPKKQIKKSLEYFVNKSTKDGRLIEKEVFITSIV